MGQSNYFSIEENKNAYYLLHSKHAEERIKIISAIENHKLEEVTIRVMPVPDSNVSSFLAYINGKNSSLNYAWTGINRLTIHKDDKYFC